MLFSQNRLSLRFIAAFGLGLFALLVFVEANLIYRKDALEPQTIVEHTVRILDDVHSLVLKTQRAKMAQMDFLATGSSQFLHFYYDAVKTTPGHDNDVNGDTRPIAQMLEEFRQLTADDPPGEKKVQERFEALISQEFVYLGKTIEEGKRRNRKSAYGGIGADDRKIIEEIHAVAQEIEEAEEAEITDKFAEEVKENSHLDYAIVVTTVVSNAILLLAALMIFINYRRIRRTEQELHAKEAHFRAAAEGMLDSFFLFRARRAEDGAVRNLVLEHLNPAAERMLSARQDEVAGRFVDSVLPSSTDSKNIRDACLDVLREARPRESEYVVTSGPSAGRAYQQQIIPLPDGVAVTCRDITERKKIERMKNEFVSTVSHELRTPLTSIRGSLGLITGGVAGQISDQARSLLTIAYNNCERLVRLINDILDIEKIESGGMVFQIRAMPLLPVIRQVIDANQAFAEKYHVGIVLEETAPNIWSDEVMVTADGDRLTQVMTNLLSNAVKFSHPGGKVTVRCREEDGLVRIEVADKGPGIPKEFQPRIFEKFAQADSSDTRQKGGTGLGLSIVKAIVEEMKGQIGFESREGKGTTFFFTLPLVPRVEATAIISDRPRVAARQRILVCEDEPDIARLLTLILERAGFTVDIAPNAAAALALLREQSYLAMTLDLALPDKDGVSLIRELRADRRFDSLPIIVVSVKAEEGRQQIGGDAFGIIDWLKKPIDIDKLVDIVQGLYAASHKPRILHVEDDLDIVEVMRLSLQDFSEFHNAATLREARQLLQDQDFSLVILDVNLPDGQGTDLLPQMVDHSGKPIPVILFTAVEVPHEVAAKVAASLTKSRTSEEKLLETIRKIITDGHPARQKGKAA